jgi:hypothetical protein
MFHGGRLVLSDVGVRVGGEDVFQLRSRLNWKGDFFSIAQSAARSWDTHDSRPLQAVLSVRVGGFWATVGDSTLMVQQLIDFDFFCSSSC